MTIDNLFEELGVDFEPKDRKIFLQEFADVARDYRTLLGSKEEPEGRSSQLLELAAELGREVVEFSPKPAVVALRKKLFVDLGLEVPPHIAQLFQRFNFYLVQFPVTVVPKPGWGFVQLECIIEFNPEQPLAERPTAYQLFPNEEWQEVIHAWQGVKVGVDENLEFKVDPVQGVEGLSGLSAKTKAAVELKVAGKAGLIIGPFDYRIRRPKILSRGRGNVKVHWRMESEEPITEEEPRLGVVLQVPKEVVKVDAIGALVAFRTFHFLTAELRHVLEFLSERTKTFLKRGAPATDKKPWDDITAGV